MGSSFILLVIIRNWFLSNKSKEGRRIPFHFNFFYHFLDKYTSYSIFFNSNSCLISLILSINFCFISSSSFILLVIIRNWFLSNKSKEGRRIPFHFNFFYHFLDKYTSYSIFF